MFKLGVALLLQIVLLHTKDTNAYTVGLVEYFLDNNVVPYLSPLDLGNRNAKIYDEIVGNIKAAHGNIDLVVFPEKTLVYEPLDTPEGREGMTVVPGPDENVVPCNNGSQEFASFFKLLSCTAKNYQTYLVINLKEKVDCDQCSKGWLFYNTDVVFDRTGKVIARYRKYNIYLEPDTDKPETPDLVTFDTDFGETFGIFTCFDIIFESPAIDLVRKGVKNFIFTTLWIPGLPFHTTIQIQQMWAQGNNVNLLSAGGAYPVYGSGGLGIYLGNQGSFASVILPRTDNFYLVKEVPESNSIGSSCNAEVDDKRAKEWDKYTQYQEDFTVYEYKKLDLEKSKTIEETVCQSYGGDSLCCDFRINVDVTATETNSSNANSQYEYFLVARNGFRSYGDKHFATGVEICALVACSGPTIETCGHRFSDYEQISWPVTFNSISISAEFLTTQGRMQSPNSLLADFAPLPASCTKWETQENELKSSVKKNFSTVSPVDKLLAFAIFGRNYDMKME